MSRGETIRTSTGSAEVADSAADVDLALWESCFSGRCFDGRYFAVVEETLRGQFDFRYLVLTNAVTSERRVQPCFVVEESLVAGLPARWRPRGLKVKLWVAGCAAGEGGLASSEAWFIAGLVEALLFFARREKAQLVVFKEFPAECRAALSALPGYRRVASKPSTRLGLSFSSFADYMARRMTRGVRSQIRRKLRDSERRSAVTMEVVSDVSAFADEIEGLYEQTQRRSEYRFERLTRAYFAELGRQIPDRTRFFLWRRRDGTLAAFALGMLEGRTLRYLNLGMDYPEALEWNLYYRVWRDLVLWALGQKLETIHAGQLNYEVKFRLGLELVPLDLYIRAVSPFFNGLLAFILPLVAPVRWEPSLRRFPNRREL